MPWGVRQIGECNGTDVPPMVFSYSHVNVKNREGHFDVVAIAHETMTYSQLVRVTSFFRELNHSLKTRTPTPSSPKLKRKTNSPASSPSKRRAAEDDNDVDDEASEAATEPQAQEIETLFRLNVFFHKSGNIQPRDYSETKRQVMQMLGGRANARELLENGTRDVVLYPSVYPSVYPSEILTTRWVETNGMYGDFVLLENYYKLPNAAASRPDSGMESIFHHAASKFPDLHRDNNHRIVAFASSDSLRALMEPCEVIENGERAAIMAVLDATVYDYVQQFSRVPLVRLI